MKTSKSEIPELFVLRRGLKALFHYQDVDDVIDSLIIQTKHLYKEDITERLTTLLRFKPEGCTIDQNSATAREFVQNLSNQGVFDALFSFASACCSYYNGDVVCRSSCILRWHEMSSLLSEDLLVCAYLAQNHISPSSYAWPTYILSDRDSLNELMSKQIADVHAHLVGSSLNFDVNWLCLMNHVEDMNDLFMEIQNGLQNSIVSREYKSRKRSFHILSVLAAAIRLELLGRIVGVEPDCKGLLYRILKSYNPLDASTLASSVGRDIKSFASEAYQYSSLERKVTYDYAHHSSLIPPKSEACAYSVLTGERLITYRTLVDIKNGVISDWHASLFYIYLLIKQRFRHELIQTNEEVGFKNFQLYDHRKILFVKGDKTYNSQYMGLLQHLSVASMFASHAVIRQLETRVKPHTNVSNQILTTDAKINDTLLKKTTDSWRYGYIFHYIKSPDCTPSDMLELTIRHQDLRNALRKEAKAIIKSRQEENSRCELDNNLFRKVLGIDAASSEIVCRPEVFAQAYRYCRICDAQMGFTYHVGEDYYDIIDGLRAVDECICYLNFQPYDRLGHALVLGVDVTQYYCRRRNLVTMPKQVALDNTMWLYMMIKRCFTKRKILRKLREDFNELFSEVFANFNVVPSIETYYQSWLLRGDNPELYTVEGFKDTPDDVDISWHSARMLTTSEANDARNMQEAQLLYYYYHHDADCKKIGSEVITIEYTPALIQVIKSIQKRMLNKVESMRLQIECNPTSNFRIGDIDRYDEHPIQKFYSKGLNYYPNSHRISSSINTDDKGVFATSIEREYSLIAEALIRKYGGDSKVSESKVIKWMDDIREFSLKQSFIK